MTCAWCGEEILDSERLKEFQSDLHWECTVRMAAGSVAHLQKRCSCFVSGSEENDPPGMTRQSGCLGSGEAVASGSWIVSPEMIKNETTVLTGAERVAFLEGAIERQVKRGNRWLDQALENRPLGRERERSKAKTKLKKEKGQVA